MTRMTATLIAVICATCGARMARDNDDDVCSPCRRSSIEAAARRAGLLVRDAPGARSAFDSEGLLGVARHLDCTPDDALDVLFGLGMMPVSAYRRSAMLRRLVAMDSLSHVAVADALSISRWTVASYRRQLGIGKPRSHHPVRSSR